MRLAYGFSCDNGDLAAEMATLGEGIALLPRFIVAERLQSGALVAVLQGWLPPEIWLTAYFPPYEALPGRVRAFSDFIERWVAAEPTMISDALGAG